MSKSLLGHIRQQVPVEADATASCVLLAVALPKTWLLAAHLTLGNFLELCAWNITDCVRKFGETRAVSESLGVSEPRRRRRADAEVDSHLMGRQATAAVTPLSQRVAHPVAHDVALFHYHPLFAYITVKVFASLGAPGRACRTVSVPCRAAMPTINNMYQRHLLAPHAQTIKYFHFRISNPVSKRWLCTAERRDFAFSNTAPTLSEFRSFAIGARKIRSNMMGILWSLQPDRSHSGVSRLH